MIQPQTLLNVADNTGAKKVMCINVLGSKSKYASLGDIIVAVVKVCLYFKYKYNMYYCFLIFLVFFLKKIRFYFQYAC